MISLRLQILLSSVAIVSSSCGGAAPGTRPDDMSAADHERASQRDEATAEHHDAEYDPNATDTRDRRGAVAVQVPESAGSGQPYNPTTVHREDAANSRERAEQHAAAAQTLQQFEAVECRGFAPESRAACPLLSDVTGIEDIEGGVRITFATGVPVDAVIARIRCHFAYARARGYQGMGSCPLYVRGVDVRAGVGGTLELVASDAASTPLIRERTRTHTGRTR